MSKLREAAQQVVNEHEAGFVGLSLDKAVAALKAALAEPQEPVAFAFRHSDGSWHDISETEHSAGMTALYTHPAAQRQPQEPVQEPVAWMHPDDGRVIPAATMKIAVQDGGASLSSVRGYTIPLGPLRQPQEPQDEPAGTKSMTHEAIAQALSEGAPLSRDQRAVLLGLVADDKVWQRECDRLQRELAAIHPAPQRQPLPKHDQHCVDVPGYGLMATKLVRAVERAHGIGGRE